MENQNEIVANEINASFKMLIYGSLAAIFFIGMFYLTQKPKKLPENETSYTSTTNQNPNIPTTMSFEPSKYDSGFVIPENNAALAINQMRERNFNDDLKSKSISAFLICIPLFVFGRFLLKGIGWVNNNKTSN